MFTLIEIDKQRHVALLRRPHAHDLQPARHCDFRVPLFVGGIIAIGILGSTLHSPDAHVNSHIRQKSTCFVENATRIVRDSVDSPAVATWLASSSVEP